MTDFIVSSIVFKNFKKSQNYFKMAHFYSDLYLFFKNYYPHWYHNLVEMARQIYYFTFIINE